MELKDEFITKDGGKVAGFNRSTSRSSLRVMLDIALHDKAVSVDFYLMKYINGPYNGLLRHGWIGKMRVVLSSIYQCMKFPIGGMICKVHNN